MPNSLGKRSYFNSNIGLRNRKLWMDGSLTCRRFATLRCGGFPSWDLRPRLSAAVALRLRTLTAIGWDLGIGDSDAAISLFRLFFLSLDRRLLRLQKKPYRDFLTG